VTPLYNATRRLLERVPLGAEAAASAQPDEAHGCFTTMLIDAKAPTRLLERVRLGSAPKTPPSPAERLEAWRIRYNRLPLEDRLGIPEGETRSAPLYPFVVTS
jgi:hypothetical protein